MVEFGDQKLLYSYSLMVQGPETYRYFLHYAYTVPVIDRSDVLIWAVARMLAQQLGSFTASLLRRGIVTQKRIACGGWWPTERLSRRPLLRAESTQLLGGWNKFAFVSIINFNKTSSGIPNSNALNNNQKMVFVTWISKIFELIWSVPTYAENAFPRLIELHPEMQSSRGTRTFPAKCAELIPCRIYSEDRDCKWLSRLIICQSKSNYIRLDIKRI